MELFDNNPGLNLLPKDGTVHYFGRILDPKLADLYYQKLLYGIEWKNDEAFIFGKHYITNRKVAWYGDENFSYTYSRSTKEALPWTRELLQLKELVQTKAGTAFNSCLLNLYHSGDEGMAWHSDDEKTLGDTPNIGSLTLGAERKFCFRHKKTRQTISLHLEHGSLLVMKDETQTHWLHRLPKTTRVSKPRINLTFRTIFPNS